MVNWQECCSYSRARRPDGRVHAARALLFVALAAGVGRAAARPEPAAAPPVPAAAGTLCVPAGEGSLRARLKGAIEAEIDWGAAEQQCRGGPRPEGHGLRLVYRGTVPDVGPLLIVLGAGPLRPGESARNVPVNLTLVREGTGEFYATRGDGKCAFDEVRQAPLEPGSTSFRLEARGYCTQPARAVGGEDRAVLVSRFDVTAVVGGADSADSVDTADSSPSSPGGVP